MEQKINGVWCDPERMDTERLLEVHGKCLEQIDRTKSELEVISSEIGKRIMSEQGELNEL